MILMADWTVALGLLIVAALMMFAFFRRHAVARATRSGAVDGAPGTARRAVHQVPDALRVPLLARLLGPPRVRARAPLAVPT